MKFFTRKKAAVRVNRTDALAVRIAGGIIRHQKRLSDHLNRRTQHWNRASKITALLLFMVPCAILCLYLIIHSL